VGAAERRALRAIAWVALLVPAGIVEERAPTAVGENPFTLITLTRGLVPAICLIALCLRLRLLPRPQSGPEWALAAYLTVVVASSAWSLAPVSTFLKAGHLVVAYLLLVVLVRLFSSVREAMDELAAVTYVVVCLAASTALLAPEAAFTSYGGRLLSIFPALEAVVLGTVAALALGMAVAGMGPAVLSSRGARVLLGLVALCVLLLTGSRAALVFALVAVVLCSGLRWRDLTPLRVAAAVALATAAVLSPLGAILRGRLTPDALSAAVQNFGGRFPLWDDALQVVADRPLIGYGYYAGHRLGEYAERFAARGTGELPYVDGTWIETLLDVGIVGLVPLAVFGLWSAWRAVRAYDAGAVASRVALVIVLVLGVYSVQDYTLQQVGYPMVMLGVALLVTGAKARGGSVPDHPALASASSGRQGRRLRPQARVHQQEPGEVEERDRTERRLQHDAEAERRQQTHDHQ
jgi:O-antigen ligase